MNTGKPKINILQNIMLNNIAESTSFDEMEFIFTNNDNENEEIRNVIQEISNIDNKNEEQLEKKMVAISNHNEEMSNIDISKKEINKKIGISYETY